MILVHAPSRQVVGVNAAACTLLGYAEEELTGMAFPQIAPEAEQILASTDRTVPGQAGQVPPALRLALRSRAGLLLPVECRVRSVAVSGSQFLVLVVGVAAEGPGMSRGQRRGRGAGSPPPPIQHPPPTTRNLSPADNRDALTGLADRRQFEHRLGQSLRRARGDCEYHFALLFIDLDGFKAVNEALGHLQGDRVLCEIAARLSRCVRPHDLLARFGGDEFTVLVDRLRSPASLPGIAQRIQSQVQLPVEVQQRQIRLTASIGIALSWQDYRDPEAMLCDADRAMYRAKAAGKGRWAIWGQPPDHATQEES